MKPSICRAFEDLWGLVREQRLNLAPSTDKPALPLGNLPDDLSDRDLFEMSMRDVLALGWSESPSLTTEPIEIQNPHQSESEGLRLLTEFVSGKGEVDLKASGEYVEGASQPRNRLLLPTLHNGRFSVQAHLDLHGLTVEEAKEAFQRFIRRSLRLGHGCIRIIHGRGQHSVNGQPVLKEQVQRWLSSRRMSRNIVGYTSAQICDGGGGALYVLLRRRIRQPGPKF